MTKAQRIGKKLRILIAEKDLSKKEVAEFVGVDPATLSNHLRGKYSPSIEVLSKYAELLKIDINNLLTSDNDEQLKVAEKPNPYGLRKDQLELLEKLDNADLQTQEMIWSIIHTIIDARKQNK